MKTYGQHCPVAKALDLVGDRWTLLIVRELLIQGPCRYTDLKNGIPGIATNLLSDRLSDLESSGLVRREAAPPPIATTLYVLTKAGAELEPTIVALGRFGTRYLDEPGENDTGRPHWFPFAASLHLRDGNPDHLPGTLQLLTKAGPAVIEINGPNVTTRIGTVPSPTLTLEGEPDTILRLLLGQATLAQSQERGLRVDGDTAILQRIPPQT